MNHWETKASVESLTQADLAAFHARWMAPRNMIVAAAGDFRKAEMAAKLDALLANWPFKGEAAPPVPKPSHALASGTFLVDKDVNQGRVSILLPGLLRTDPDFIPAAVMNDILGGGGFTSRITNRVRSDEGLAYSAGSALVGGVWYPGRFGAAFQSKVRTSAYASQIVLEEMKKLRDGEVSDEELETAKRSFVDTLPRRFATPVQVVDGLADEEFTGRYASDPGYWAAYQAKVEKVTKADVARVAKRLLKPESATILVVGRKSELLNPDPKHPVQFEDLTGGKLVELPLRDPLTMQPLRRRGGREEVILLAAVLAAQAAAAPSAPPAPLVPGTVPVRKALTLEKASEMRMPVALHVARRDARRVGRRPAAPTRPPRSGRPTRPPGRRRSSSTRPP